MLKRTQRYIINHTRALISIWQRGGEDKKPEVNKAECTS